MKENHSFLSGMRIKKCIPRIRIWLSLKEKSDPTLFRNERIRQAKNQRIRPDLDPHLCFFSFFFFVEIESICNV